MQWRNLLNGYLTGKIVNIKSANPVELMTIADSASSIPDNFFTELENILKHTNQDNQNRED